MDTTRSERAARERQAATPFIRDIEAAASLVGAGQARRVVLVGLPDLTELWPQAITIGQRLGIRVRLDNSAAGSALIVERLASSAEVTCAPLGITPRPALLGA